MLQQFNHFLLRFWLHLDQDLFGAVIGKVGEKVGGCVGVHLLDNVGCLLRIERLDNRLLNLGLDLFQSLGRGLFVQGLKDSLALVGSQFLDNVGDVGRV